MRIGYDAKRYYKNRTGLGNYSRRLIDQLSSLHAEDDFYLFVANEKNPIANYPNQVIINHKALFPALWRSFSIKRDIAKQSVDLYHGLSNELFSGELPNVKKIVTIHDIIFKIYPQYFPKIDRIFYDYKTAMACKNADKIIAVSENTKNDLLRHYPIKDTKIEVIHPPMKIIENSNVDTQKDGPRYWLYVGTVEERKDVLLLIKAVQKLNEKLPLYIIGDGKKYLSQVKEYVMTNHLEKQVIFLSHISDQELHRYYQGALAVIYPSMYEGFGLPILEAIQYGKPVITTHSSSLPEAGGSIALYIKAGDVNDLMEKMTYVLAGYAPSNEQVQKHLSHFKDIHTIEKVYKLYHKL